MNAGKCSASIVLTLVFVAIVVASAAAVTLPSPSFSVSRGLSEDGPFVAANPSTGDFLVIWSPPPDVFTGPVNVFGQLVSPEGARGSAITVAGGSARAVASNAIAGEYLVVYRGSCSS